jgi:hypothetical protein
MRSLAGILALSGSLAAGAQVAAEFRTAPRSLITEKVDRSRVVPTTGAVRPSVAQLTDLGEVEGTLPMEHMQLLLNRPAERQAAFDAEVEALHTPSNPSFHKWLTPDVVGQEFGLSQADLATIVSFLESEGFTIGFVAKGGYLIDFTGSAAQVSNTFRTKIHYVRMPDGEVKDSALTAAYIPAALAPAVKGFVSLSNVPAAKPMLKKKVSPEQTAAALAKAAGLLPQDTNSVANSDYFVGPQDFYTIYDENSLLTASTPINGTGQTLALIEQSDINTADVTFFRKTFNVVPNTPSLTVQHGSASISCNDPGILDSQKAGFDEGEAVLDAEWASSVAPAATVLFMACASTKATGGIFLSAESLIQDNLAPVMSLSYGYYEAGSTTEDTLSVDLWEQAASQGQTVVVSSGDGGSDAADQGAAYATDGYNVNGFSSTAYNVSAGGTDFQDYYNQLEGDAAYQDSVFWASTNGTGKSSALSYIPEMPWNNTCASSILSFLETGSTSSNAFCDTALGQEYFLEVGGGGGGISIKNARPAWQANGAVYGISQATGTNFRLQPDISMFAANGVYGHALDFYESDDGTGSYEQAGGTSFVAPQLAGIFTLLNQSTGERQGQPDYVLYSMAALQYGTTTATGACNGSGATGIGTTTSLPASTCIFHDVETGNISQACLRSTADCYRDKGSFGILETTTTSGIPAYSSAEGYDLATGLGSVDIANLVNNWQSPTSGKIFTPTVTLTPATTTYTYGAPTAISYLAVLTGPGSFPTGSVTFAGSPIIGTIGTEAITQSTGCNYKTNGTCTESATQGYTPSATTVLAGSYSVTATYAPPATNENYGTGTGTATITVNKQLPTLTITAPTATVTYGSASVTITAKLAFTGTGLAPTTASLLTFQVAGLGTFTATCTGTTTPLTCSYVLPLGTAVSSGTYAITASYLGDTNYLGTTGTGTLTYGKASTINFTEASPQHTMYPTIALAPTSNSTGAFSYTVISGPATVAGSTLTLTGAGTVVVRATQAAAGTYTPTYTSTSFTVLAGSIWIGDNSNAVSTFDELGNAITGSGSGLTGAGIATIASPSGEAFDASGYLWVASSAGVSEFKFPNPTAVSATPYTVGGISSPIALAIDGASQVWVANSNGTISTLSDAGKALSPTTGYTASGVSSTVGGIAIDISGNVWVSNGADGSVTEVMGAAVPVAPASTALANGTTGATP